MNSRTEGHCEEDSQSELCRLRSSRDNPERLNSLAAPSRLCSVAMNITELHAENFEQEVVNADRPVCIDFWAPWCGPCRMLSPVIEELAAEEPAIKFCKVNVDDEPGLAAQFGVSSIPTLIFSKNGALTGRTVGFRPKAELLELIDGIKD